MALIWNIQRTDRHGRVLALMARERTGIIKIIPGTISGVSRIIPAGMSLRSRCHPGEVTVAFGCDLWLLPILLSTGKELLSMIFISMIIFMGYTMGSHTQALRFINHLLQSTAELTSRFR